MKRENISLQRRLIPTEAVSMERKTLAPLTSFTNNRVKKRFDVTMKKPQQSAVTDTAWVDDMVTQDSNTLNQLHALISEESKDRNLHSPPDSSSKSHNHLHQITDISSSSVKISHKYEYPKYLTQSFSDSAHSHKHSPIGQPCEAIPESIMEQSSHPMIAQELSLELPMSSKEAQFIDQIENLHEDVLGTTSMDISSSLHIDAVESRQDNQTRRVV